MPNLPEVILTACFTSIGTVLAGVLVLVVGQIVMKLAIEPITEQHKLITNIASSIVLHANVGRANIQMSYNTLEVLDQVENLSEQMKTFERERHNDIIKRDAERINEVSLEFRRYASELASSTHAIKGYRIWALFGVVPPQKKALLAARELIGLSNSIGVERSTLREHQTKIKELLKIDTI